MPFAANAAGLGKLTVISGLGEPLNAEIELLSVTKGELSSLSARIAPGSVYAEQGIELTATMSAIRVELANKPDGMPVLRLTTTQPVNDPFLDLLISVDWSSGRLLREYTALLDPPGFGDQLAADSTGAPVVQGESISADTGSPSGAMRPQGKKSRPHAAQIRRNMAASREQAARGSAGPTQAEAPAGEYTTRRGDTLRSIAAQMPVEGVSLEQLLVGFYRANKSAFVGGNMNRLKVGQIMRQPSTEELQGVSQQEAVGEIRIQTADWNAYRNKLASAVAESAPASKEEAARQSASGKITAPAEDKAVAPVTGPHDVVKLSRSDTGTAKAGSGAEAKGAGTASQGKLAALQEDATAREKAAKEAGDRAATLEKQVQEMKKLLELKNQTMADLQKGEAARKAEPAKPAVPPAAAPQPMPAKPVPAQAAPVQAPVAAPPAAVTQPPAAQPEKPKPKPRKPIKRVPVESAPEPGFIDNLLANQGLLAGGIGGVFAVLGGAWLYYRNKRRKGLDAFEQGILTASGLKPNTVFGNTAGGSVDTGDTSFLTDFSQGTGGGMIDTNEVDPVAEAEVYMAYGRDVQAEEILKDAIEKEPKRFELHHKLLEIYANRKDNAAFETLAGELYATLGATDSNWAKVAEIGRKLEPGNPLYADQPVAKSVEESMEATQIYQAPVHAETVKAAQDKDIAAEAGPSLDFSLDAEAAEPPEVVPAADMQTEESSLDFDISALADAEQTATMEIPSEPAEARVTDSSPQLDIAGSAEAAGLDFAFELPEPAASENVQLDAAELGMDVLPKFEEAAAVGGVEEVLLESPVIPTEETAEDMGVKEFSVEQPDVKIPPVQEVPATEPSGESESIVQAAEEADSGGLDFDFDLGGAAEPSPQSQPAESSQAVPDLDLSGISLNLDEGEKPAVAMPEDQKTALSSAESADVDTKLDLVTAYLDMGDKEGARELLQEVLQEGGPQQRERAQKMLDTLN